MLSAVGRHSPVSHAIAQAAMPTKHITSTANIFESSALLKKERDFDLSDG